MRETLMVVSLLLMLCLTGTTAGWAAELDPDLALLRKAEQAYADQHYADAATALTTLRTTHAQSAYLPEATVLLYQVALAQNTTAQAEALWQEVVTRWPQSDYLWQVVEARYQVQRQTQPALALAQVEQALADGLLPPSAAARVQRLRFAYLEVHEPATFLTEALAVIDAAKDAPDRQALALPMELARKVYLPLLRSKEKLRAYTAKTISETLQAKLAMMGDPEGWIPADTLAFLTALAQTEPAVFVEQATPIVRMAQWAETDAEALLSAGVARLLYPHLVAANQLDEARQTHLRIQGVLQQRGNPQGALQADTQAYLAATAAVDPAAFLASAMTNLQTIPADSTPEELHPLAELAAKTYAPLMAAGRVEEADALYQRVQAALTKQTMAPSVLPNHQRAYLLALAAAHPDRFLQAAWPVASTIGDVKTLAEVQLRWELARRLYPLLMAAHRQDDVTALHTQVQAAVAPFSVGNQWATEDRVAYVQALARHDPDAHLTGLVALAKGVTTAKDAKQAVAAATFAQQAFPGLMSAGRFDEATMLYRETVTALHAQNSDAGMTMYRYLSALRAANPERYQQEVTALLADLSAIQQPGEAKELMMHLNPAYATLLKAGNIEELTHLHTEVQQLLTQMGNPFNLVAQEQATYFGVLWSDRNRERFLEAVLAYAHRLPELSADEVAVVLKFTHQTYETLMAARRDDEAYGLHQQVQAALARLNLATQALADRDDFCALWARIAPARFQRLATEYVAQTLAATRLTDIPLTPAILQAHYRLLMQQNRVHDAKQLHEQLTAVFRTLKAHTLAAGEQQAFLESFTAATPEQFLAFALPVLTAAAEATTVEDLQLAAGLAIHAYPRLLQLTRFGEATQHHTRLQTAIARVGNPEGWARRDTLAYTKALAISEPRAYLAAAKPLIEAAQGTTSLAEMTEIVELVGLAYNCLTQTGNLDSARQLHAQMQTALARLKAETLIAQDQEAYTNRVSQHAVDGMFFLFKKALAANDRDTANKWLQNMNQVAPEHPRAVEARKMFQAMAQ